MSVARSSQTPVSDSFDEAINELLSETRQFGIAEVAPLVRRNAEGLAAGIRHAAGRDWATMAGPYLAVINHGDLQLEWECGETYFEVEVTGEGTYRCLWRRGSEPASVMATSRAEEVVSAFRIACGL